MTNVRKVFGRETLEFVSEVLAGIGDVGEEIGLLHRVDHGYGDRAG